MGERERRWGSEGGREDIRMGKEVNTPLNEFAGLASSMGECYVRLGSNVQCSCIVSPFARLRPISTEVNNLLSIITGHPVKF